MEPSQTVTLNHIQERWEWYGVTNIKHRDLGGEGLLACGPTVGWVRDLAIQRPLFQDMPAELRGQFKRFRSLIKKCSKEPLPRTLYFGWYSAQEHLLVFPYATERNRDELMRFLTAMFSQNGGHIATRLLGFDCVLQIGSARVGRMKELFRLASKPPSASRGAPIEDGSALPAIKASSN